MRGFGPPPPMFRGFPHEGGGYYFHHGGGPHPLAWVIFALLLVVLVALAALIAAQLAGRRKPPWRLAGAGPADPLAVLRFRYARGELSREEFLQASQDLGAGEPAERPPS